MSYTLVQKIISLGLLTGIIAAASLPAPTHALTLQCHYVEDSAALSNTSSGAQPVPVQLSEIYPAPVSGQEEFIELYNPNDMSVDLSGLALVDASGKKFVIPADDASIVSAKGYISFAFGQTKIYLNNDGDTINLLDASGVVVEHISYTNAVSGQSWSRGTTGVGGTAQWQWTTIPTRNAGNIVFNDNSEVEGQDPDTETDVEILPPAPTNESALTTQTNPHLRINELYPDPIGTDTNNEWIEILNTQADATHLQGWVITDGSTRYTLTSQIITGGGGLLLLPSSQSKISLNNGGETIQLIDPNGSVIDAITYTKAKEGNVWAKIGGEFIWSALPTPGTTNALLSSDGAGGDDTEETTSGAAGINSAVKTTSKAVASTPPTQISVAASKSQENGAEVMVEGIITSAPGELSSQIMTMQDDTSGVQIYSYKKQFPAGASVGTRVRVTGEVAESRGNKRIKISQVSDIEILAAGETVAAREIDALDENVDGMLVRTSSAIADKSGAAWDLENGVSLHIKSGKGIQGKLFKEGAEVDATGIVEVSGDIYRLVPRTSSDIVLAGNAVVDNDEDAAKTDVEQNAATTKKSENSSDTKSKVSAAAVNTFQAAKGSPGRAALVLILITVIGVVIAASVFKDRIGEYLAKSQHPLLKRLASWPFIQKLYPPSQLLRAPMDKTTNPPVFTQTQKGAQELATKQQDSQEEQLLPFLALKQASKQSQLDPSL